MLGLALVSDEVKGLPDLDSDESNLTKILKKAKFVENHAHDDYHSNPQKYFLQKQKKDITNDGLVAVGDGQSETNSSKRDLMHVHL